MKPLIWIAIAAGLFAASYALRADDMHGGLGAFGTGNGGIFGTGFNNGEQFSYTPCFSKGLPITGKMDRG